HTPTPPIHTLSLHDALPISTQILLPCLPKSISEPVMARSSPLPASVTRTSCARFSKTLITIASCLPVKWRRKFSLGSSTLSRERSEEHTSELQSLAYLVCRL